MRKPQRMNHPNYRPAPNPCCYPSPAREKSHPKSTGFIGRTHGKLVHIELAQHPRAVFEQIGRDRGFILRRKAFQNATRRCGGYAFGAEQVFHANRYTQPSCQAFRPLALASSAAFAAFSRMVRRFHQKSVEWFCRADTIDEGFGNFNSREITVINTVADARNAQFVNVRHYSKDAHLWLRQAQTEGLSITQSPSAHQRSHVPAQVHWRRTLSRLSPSFTSSSRSRSVLGITAVIGSTLEQSTSPKLFHPSQDIWFQLWHAVHRHSSSVIAIRDRLAIFFTVSLSTDMIHSFPVHFFSGICRKYCVPSAASTGALALQAE